MGCLSGILLLSFCGTLNAALIDAHRILQAPVEGIADKGVAYRHLVNPRYAFDEVLQILGIEVVARIEAEAYATCLLGSCNIGGNRRLAILGIARSIGLGI